MRKELIFTYILICILSCIDHNDFSTPKSICIEDEIKANATFADVKALYSEEIVQIQNDLVIEGYVISSDETGNFFGTLHIQDTPSNPTEGFQVDIDIRDSHLFYRIGEKIYIKLKGLYLDESNDIYRVGGIYRNAGGTLSVGRLPAAKVKEHIFNACGTIQSLSPKNVSIAELSDKLLNTCIQLDDFQVAEEDLMQPYAIPGEYTDRTLKNCNGSTIILRNSGYADFQNEILPEGSGSVVGVLGKYGNNYQLIIRDLNDLSFTNRYPDCYANDVFVFLSELADPDNNLAARFIELYNSSDADINLNGWELRRYTNENTEVSSRIDLSGNTILSKSTFVIAGNAAEFEAVYGFHPDMEAASSSSAANSNGDDNIELVNSVETVIDLFGVVGEDGSNTNHEFEDGKAVRNPGITNGNPVYTFSEWTVYNDTGDAGITNQPQQAPDDFTPGVR